MTVLPNTAELQRVVEMQRRSYLLLKWLAEGVSSGLITFRKAHDYSTLPDAAQDWIAEHYLNIPVNARPDRDDLPVFCAFFSTYLKNSFDLESDPGKQLYSPDAHCFCPMCSWLVQAPNLKSKKVAWADKKRANRLRADAIRDCAIKNGVDIDEREIAELLNDRSAFEDASLMAYGRDLLRRTKGIATGPAVLALWRGFAWDENGSPKQRFRLRSKEIVNAERRMLDRFA